MKNVNGTVNATEATKKDGTQVLENAWRRVPESNRSSRICNPDLAPDFVAVACKCSRDVLFGNSTTYGPTVNEVAAPSDAISHGLAPVIDPLRAAFLRKRHGLSGTAGSLVASLAWGDGPR